MNNLFLVFLYCILMLSLPEPIECVWFRLFWYGFSNIFLICQKKNTFLLTFYAIKCVSHKSIHSKIQMEASKQIKKEGVDLVAALYWQQYNHKIPLLDRCWSHSKLVAIFSVHKIWIFILDRFFPSIFKLFFFNFVSFVFMVNRNRSI